MSYRSLATVGLAVVICSVCSGCLEFRVTGECNNGCRKFPVTGDWSCTKEDAEKSASGKCAGTFTALDTDVQLGGVCTARTAPLPYVISDAVQRASQRVGLTRESQEVDVTADEPTCPPQMVDLKVTVFHDVGTTSKEAQVQYYKKIASGHEYVTLSAMVPVGGKHEFICTDAEVELGNVNSLWVKLGGSRAFIIPADGSSLECHANTQTNVLEAEIIPPPADATAPQQIITSPALRELVPIPDPMFSPRDR